MSTQAALSTRIRAASTETIDPVDMTKLSKLETEWAQALVDLSDVPCSNPAQEHWWKERLAYVQGHIIDHEAEREVLVRPLIDDKTRIDKLFKKAGKPLNDVKDMIKAKLKASAEATLLAQESVRAAAVLAAQNGDSEACALALASIPEATVSASWSWVIDSVDTAILPAEYMVVDYAKLESIALGAKKSEKAPVVPGVVFKRSANITARRGK